MTRTISTALQTHMAGEVTTLAMCWKVTRTDSTIMGFTNHDRNITFDSVTYLAATGMTPSTTKCNSDMSVDNLEIDSVLDSSVISEADLMGGLYDYAALQVFLVNYNDLTMGNLVIRTGYLGQVTLNKNQFTAELRGMAQKLQEYTGDIVSPLCGANFGDTRCTINLTPFTVTGSVTAVTNNMLFSASSLTQGANYFTNGKITWTSGNNNGRQMEIKAFLNKTVTLALAMSNDILAGDTFSIVAGCDKTNATCQNTFNNLINFRGFPSVPGMNALLTTSGTINSVS